MMISLDGSFGSIRKLVKNNLSLYFSRCLITIFFSRILDLSFRISLDNSFLKSSRSFFILKLPHRHSLPKQYSKAQTQPLSLISLVTEKIRFFHTPFSHGSILSPDYLLTSIFF